MRVKIGRNIGEYIRVRIKEPVLETMADTLGDPDAFDNLKSDFRWHVGDNARHLVWWELHLRANYGPRAGDMNNKVNALRGT